MENLIVVGILLILIGAATFYMCKEKKKGARCIGCPSAGCCSGKGYGSKKENGCRITKQRKILLDIILTIIFRK